MKKVFTLFAAIVMCVAAHAQLQFCYQDGTVIPDGSVVVANTPNDFKLNLLNTYEFHSGVYVKNASASAAVVSLTSNVKSINTGDDLSVCLGTLCRNYSQVGTYTIDNENLSANSTNDLQSHWSPAYVDGKQHYSKCEVEFSLLSGGSKVSSITVIFSYDDPTGVQSVRRGASDVVATYNVCGQKASAAHKGLVLRKMADGNVRKVMVK